MKIEFAKSLLCCASGEALQLPFKFFKIKNK